MEFKEKPKHTYAPVKGIPTSRGIAWADYTFPGHKEQSKFINKGPKEAAKKAIRKLAVAKYGDGEDHYYKPVCVHLKKITGRTHTVKTFCGMVRPAEEGELSQGALDRGVATVVEFTDKGEE